MAEDRMADLAETGGYRRGCILALMAIALTGAGRLEADSLPSSGHAAALYVSTRGDDHNDGSSIERPLRSIVKAIALAGPGTTVYIEKGRYFERLVTQRAGARGAEITITSFNGAAQIDGSALGWAAGGNQNQGLIELRHPFVKLVGLEITHARGTGILLDADDLTVERCHIMDTRLHGISTDTDRQTHAEKGAGVMIKRVVISGNFIERTVLGGSGQAISLIADGFVVSGNTVRNNPKEGIDIWLGARRGEVTGNTVYGNGAAGIFVDGAAHVKIHRNIVYHNRAGIGISSEDPRYETHDISVFNNVLYDNRESGFFLWDNPRRPGHYGVQNVLIAHNTSVGSRHVVYLTGKRNTVRVLNNLGYSTSGSVQDEAAKSTVLMQGNVWLGRVDGFVTAGQHDFRLGGNSPSIDKGVVIPPVIDDRGVTFSISEDFEGKPRVIGSLPDAGAFEYSASPGVQARALP